MTVSVVVPAYNEEAYLAACLRSLSNQSRPADQIIVVDNNSTDKTAVIARKYGATVIGESKQGIMPAVCTGYDACTSDVIARCDADSVLPPDWLEKIEQALVSRDSAAAITGPGKFYGTSRLASAAANVWYMYAYFGLVGFALARWPLFGSNFAIRRDVWIAIRGDVHTARNDLHDDIDLTMHLGAQDDVIFDRNLIVGISARSLRRSGLRQRYAMGFRSLMIHWPEQAPWRRWYKKVSA